MKSELFTVKYIISNSSVGRLSRKRTNEKFARKPCAKGIELTQRKQRNQLLNVSMRLPHNSPAVHTPVDSAAVAQVADALRKAYHQALRVARCVLT